VQLLLARLVKAANRKDLGFMRRLPDQAGAGAAPLLITGDTEKEFRQM
jgi:hypothetical protein